MSKIGVTAHRGCKGYIPENTLISFKEALDMKVDVLEYDVHMCLDGELIIMHDSLAVRTTGAKGAVDFMTLAEIKALDAGETLYGAEYKGTPVPTLRETLELFASYDYQPEQIIEALERDDIEARPLWKPMHLQPLFSSCALVSRHADAASGASVSGTLYEQGLCLPSDIKMTDADAERVIRIVRGCFSHEEAR